jgi:hypothetical protein
VKYCAKKVTVDSDRCYRSRIFAATMERVFAATMERVFAATMERVFAATMEMVSIG